jgi:hypothetical protein
MAITEGVTSCDVLKNGPLSNIDIQLARIVAAVLYHPTLFSNILELNLIFAHGITEVSVIKSL